MSNQKNTKSEEINVLWALLCRSASVDQSSNTLSLFNLLEEFTLSKTPIQNSTQLPTNVINFPQKTKIKENFSFVIQLQRKGNQNLNSFESKVRVEIIDPSGEVLSKDDIPMIFEQGKAKMRMIINFGEMLLTKSGNYKYQVSLPVLKGDKFEKQAESNLEVRIFS